MKLPLWTLMSSVLLALFSCNKSDTPTPPKVPTDTSIVSISTVLVQDFDNVVIQASFQGIDTATVRSCGFYWGYSPDLSTSNRQVLSSPTTFKATLDKVGQGKTVYFKAFIVVGATRRPDDGLPTKTFESKTEKTATSGLVKTWEKEYNGISAIQTEQVLPTDDNAFVILANMFGGGSSSWPRLIKMDTAGNILWDKQYHEQEHWTAAGMTKVKDGYLLAANYTSLNASSVAITKLDLNGNLSWERKLDIVFKQEFIRFQLLKDDVIKVTVRTVSGYTPNPANPTLTDCWFDKDGNQLSNPNGVRYDQFINGLSVHKTVTAADSSFLVAYQYYYYDPSPTTSRENAKLHYFEKDNQLRWERTYGKTGYDLPVNVTVTATGNFSILGYTLLDNRKTRLWLFQVDNAHGNSLWEYTYTNPQYDAVYPSGITMGKDDQYYITGSAQSVDYKSSAAYILKVNAQGYYAWSYTFPATAFNSRGEYIFVNNTTGEIYVFGTSTRDGWNHRAMYVTKWKEL
ncbi:hypothetical protein HGH92_31365 [Chitinophaga varians]|uniref:Uncharacterized protein n=1 Tax=Chitinophaga varians TaxID=2202339 RepID=A0A847S0C1_9BACT|nr:hypothetical protein [Chitinophaga varians]NLR68842.1 hypothetical protein [Chitinophaga varians]